MLEDEVQRAIDKLQTEVAAIARKHLMAIFGGKAVAPTALVEEQLQRVPRAKRATAPSSTRRSAPAKRSTASKSTASKSTSPSSMPASNPTTPTPPPSPTANVPAGIGELAAKVLDFLDDNRNAKIGRDQIIRALRLSPDTVTKILRLLVEQNRVVRFGVGRTTVYWLSGAGDETPVAKAGVVGHEQPITAEPKEPKLKAGKQASKASSRAAIDALVEEGLKKRLATGGVDTASV